MKQEEMKAEVEHLETRCREMEHVNSALKMELEHWKKSYIALVEESCYQLLNDRITRG